MLLCEKITAMYSSFHIKTSELDENFIKGIKALFKSKRIAITVEEYLDETKYLLSTEANRKHLEEALKSKAKSSFTFDDFKKHTANLKSGKKKAA